MKFATLKNGSRDGRLILVQRQSDDFAGPCDDYPFPSEADNCDG